MSARNVGVFLNAEHLLGARSAHRTYKYIAERIDAATAPLMPAGDIAYRVVVGDCSIGAARRFADGFAAKGGYRVRHRPEHQTVEEIITAEIVETAMPPTAALRVAVVGDNPARYSALVPALESLNIWVIFIHTAGTTERLKTLSYALDLAPESLAGPLAAATAALKKQGQDVDAVTLEAAMRHEIQGFSPKYYGHKTMSGLLTEIQKTEMGTERSKREDRPEHGSSHNRHVVPTTLLARSGVGSGVTAQNASKICLALALERSDLQDLVSAMREVVELLMEESDFRAAAKATGLPLTVVGAGFRAAVPNYVKTATNKLSKLFELANLGADWLLVRNIMNRPDLRLVQGQVPEGFEFVSSSLGRTFEASPDIGAESAAFE